MSPRTWALTGGAVLVAVLVTGGLVAMSTGADQATPAAQQPPATTAAVERGKLSDMVSVDGTLTYRARSDGAPYSAINQASGIYTELPEAGDKVRCGDALYRVDDEPVLLLCGAIPAYRDVAIGDEGPDVGQLNRNLDESGDEFTWRTREALEKLQHDAGLDATGELDLGAAVFLPKAVRIAKVTGRLGGPARPGAQVAQATSSTLEVQVHLGASQQGEISTGDRARITLPGNTSVTGKVDRLGRAAETPEGQDANAADATIRASISLDDPAKARGLDRAPVQVDITTKGVAKALSVPVTALVGKAGGGYAVEVVRDDGRRELVAVRLGLFDTTSGRVEADGELHEGDQVVVPSP